MMKDLWKILLSILLTLLGVGLILLVSGPPRGEPIRLLPPASPAPLVVHVAGEVLHPGVYSLPIQSRVQDAIQAAGGFLSTADQQALNLAAFIEDGSRIEVPSREKSSPTPPISAAIEENPAGPEATQAETLTPKAIFPIDINTADQFELELLPQIGPVRAARILAYRNTNGPFKRVEDIQNVYDINAEIYAAIRDLIIASEIEVPPAETPTPGSPAQ